MSAEYDFFLYYDSSDANWVQRKLIRPFRRAQVKYIEEKAFELGKNRLGAFEEAVSKSKFVILVITQKFTKNVEAEYVRKLAQYHNLETDKSVVIPLRLEKVTVPLGIAQLVGIEMVDAETDEEKEAAIDRLFDLIHKKKPSEMGQHLFNPLLVFRRIWGSCIRRISIPVYFCVLCSVVFVALGFFLYPRICEIDTDQTDKVEKLEADLAIYRMLRSLTPVDDLVAFEDKWPTIRATRFKWEGLYKLLPGHKKTYMAFTTNKTDVQIEQTKVEVWVKGDFRLIAQAFSRDPNGELNGTTGPSSTDKDKALLKLTLPSCRKGQEILIMIRFEGKVPNWPDNKKDWSKFISIRKAA